MITLKKIYSIPQAFKPVEFTSGINVILGEKSDGNNKSNGVGKSMCIEFLNFCLLKKSSDSRVCCIPENVLDPATVVYLDLAIHNDSITICRSIKTPDLVTVFKNGNEVITNDTIEQASDFLGNIYFGKFSTNKWRISFRSLLNPVLRDERSEFKDIIQCFDTAKRIPPDYKPHLFFLDLDIDRYSELNNIINDLEKKNSFVSELRNQIKRGYEKVSEAKAKLNDLDSEVSKINASMEQLKTNASFNNVQDDIIQLESQLSLLRTKQKALKYEIKQLSSLPEPENISEKEMALLFNQFKTGLGDMVEKSLFEVKEFKNRIDAFRNTIINGKLEDLKKELYDTNTQVQKFDDDYNKKLSLLDTKGVLKDLKTAIHIHNSKNQERDLLRTTLERFESASNEKKLLFKLKEDKLADFDEMLTSKKELIKQFEETILTIHEVTMGNRHAHFDLKIKTSAKAKEFLQFDFRITDDGSYGTNRMRVFIYDAALLFNEISRSNHPGLLVHDNLFNVDNDSLEKSLNFLHKQAENHPGEFQYILTLNREMVEGMEERKLLDFNIGEYERARFTKDSRFLGKKYSERKGRYR